MAKSKAKNRRKTRRASKPVRELVGKHAWCQRDGKQPALVFVLSRCILDGLERYLVEHINGGSRELVSPDDLQEAKHATTRKRQQRGTFARHRS
jgi:hypothetical protein